MVVHVKETAKKKECTKKCDSGATLLFYLLNLLFFCFFFLCSVSVWGVTRGGGGVVLFNHFAEPPQLF